LSNFKVKLISIFYFVLWCLQYVSCWAVTTIGTYGSHRGSCHNIVS